MRYEVITGDASELEEGFDLPAEHFQLLLTQRQVAVRSTVATAGYAMGFA